MNAQPNAAAESRLTAAVIVADTTIGLADTLSCALLLADEVLVVDGGSREDWRSLVNQRQAEAGGEKLRTFEGAWCDDFASVKNQALLEASGDWLLWLECGETLSAADAAELRASATTGLDRSEVYFMIVKSPATAGAIAAEQVAQIRLLPLGVGLRYDGRIRETVLPSLRAAGLQVEGLPWRIHRSAADHNPQVKRSRARRNARLARMQVQQHGSNAGLVNCLAEASSDVGRSAEAIELFQQALSQCEAGSAEMIEAYYGMLAALDAQPQGRERQIKLCVEALEVFPLDAQLLCALGGYLQGQGRLDLALRAYQTAWEHGKVNPLVWHLDAIQEIAAVCLAAAHQLADRQDDARRVLRQAAEDHPKSERVRSALLDLEIKLGDAEAGRSPKFRCCRWMERNGPCWRPS